MVKLGTRAAMRAKPRTLESHVVRDVNKWAKKQGIIAIKFTPSGDVGWPDYIYILPNGKHLWLEFKRPGKHPTELQYYRLAELRSNGATAQWFDDAQKAIGFIEDHL